MDTILGFIAGLLVFLLVSVTTFEYELNQGTEARKIIEECQETLPRNVRCVIIAVPETEIEG